jgi:hypothetical protein
MTINDLQNIEVEGFYINGHTIKQFKKRNIKYQNFSFDFDTKAKVIIQRYKKNVKIKEAKGCIRISNDLNGIFNIYKHKENGKIYFKLLTILTKFQTRVSTNLGFANTLNKDITIKKIKKVNFKNFYFNQFDFIDVFKVLEWSEQDVIFPFEVIERKDFPDKVKFFQSPVLKRKIILKDFKRDGYSIIVEPTQKL